MTDCVLNSRWTDDTLILEPKGDWVLEAINKISKKKLTLKEAKRPKHLILDFKNIAHFDSIGAAQLKVMIEKFSLAPEQIELKNIPPEQDWFIEEYHKPAVIHRTSPRQFDTKQSIMDLGHQAVSVCREFYALMSFSGLFYLKILQLFFTPKYFRPKALINQIKYMGIDSVPIVSVLLFLIGIVLAYQGIDQFKKFGAEIFVVNLLGISVLREIGVLITSIIIAGRSGSAITAQIGSMKINREIDALKVIGLDHNYVLIVPRILALIIILPIMTFVADMAGLFGGAVMCYFTIDLTFDQFLTQLQLAVDDKAFFVGLVKAPFFGFVIALIGTFQGFQVQHSADSLGKMTTRSVVQSIFAIIVLDAFFSILFSMYGI